MGAMKAMARDFAGLLGIDAAKVASDNPDTLRDVVEDAKEWIMCGCDDDRVDRHDIRLVMDVMVMVARAEESYRADPQPSGPYRLY